MGFGALCRRVGLAALALAPLGAAAVLVTAFARDLSESASAIIAAATGLSLLGFLQLASLTRETRHLNDKQDEVRAQALALARCMKILNARLVALEPEMTARPDLEILETGITTEPSMHSPSKRRSAIQEPVAVVPLFDPLGSGLWGWEIGQQPPPSRRFFTGSRIASPDLALCARIQHAAALLADRKGRLLVTIEAAPSRTPKAVALAGTLTAANQAFSTRFIFGVPQRLILGSAADAGSLAALARTGVAMALTDVTDFRIDPGALAACGIRAVRIDAERLIEASRDGLTAAATMAGDLGRSLGLAGVELLCDGVLDRSMLPLLARIGVAAASGPALQGSGDVVSFPWRAASSPRTNGLPEASNLRRAG